MSNWVPQRSLLRSRAASVWLDRLAPFVVFLAMAALLISARWTVAQQATYPDGDFGSNSLLVQDAKSFRLLVGNYSRIGFNHPGPAILYALAAGEYFFHDRLKWTPYPLGGQLLGATVFAAFWIALLFRLLQRLAVTTGAAALALACFLAVTALVMPRSFGDLWFPHLYYMPFAVFFFALVQLTRGRIDSLFILAISWGVLLNGHIAFFPITAIMIIWTVGANAWLARSNPQATPLLRRATWKGRVASAAGAVFVLGLFLVPLGIRMFIETPNPLVQYLTYSQGNAWNYPWDSAAFLVVFWGGWLGFPFLAAWLWLIWRGERHRNDDILVRVFSSTILGATVAVFFYATVGIDYLSMTYVAYFYHAAAISLAPLTAILACRWRAEEAPGRFVLPTALVTLLLLVPVWRDLHFLEAKIGNPSIPADYARMRALSPLPLVLDLDITPNDKNDYGRVWSILTGVEDYAKRQGVDPLFVLYKRWHIIFTTHTRMPKDAPEPARFLYLTTVDRPGAAARIDGISFMPVTPLMSPPGSHYDAVADPWDFNVHLLDSGWSMADGGYVWSQEADIVLRFNFPQPGPHRVHLDFGAFLPGNRTQHIDVTANGVNVGQLDLTNSDRHEHDFNLPAGLKNPVLLDLRIAHPMRPHDYEFSRDTRKLGVSLYSVGVD